METFKISVNGHEYIIEPALHDGFYTVSRGNKSAILGKGKDGKWEFSLQSSSAVDMPAEEIGEAIEHYQA